MSVRRFLGLPAGALVACALAGSSGIAQAVPASCGSSVGSDGYTYAGHQATDRGDGVRATITALRAPEVAAGHVAGWVGVGGPGQGPNGTDEWMQVGLASLPGLGTFVYSEVARGHRAPAFHLVEDEVAVGESRHVAVLEMARRPNWWRVWVGGRPVSAPVHLPGSSEQWEPIATAESWTGGEAACNSFSYRFEHVSVAHGRGGSWFAFTPGYRFLDGNYRLRTLASVHARRAVSAVRMGANGGPAPYAFIASS